MGQFIFRRTLYAVATLFILSLTIFTVVRLTGDPVTLMAEPGAQEADLDRVYNDFLEKVGQGRGMSKDAVRAVAKGQVWSGTAAKQNGLVDKLGGLMTAVDVLRPLAKIGPDEAVLIEPYPNTSDKIQAAIAKLLGVDNTSLLSPSMLRLMKIAGPLLNEIDIATNPAADERLRAPLP